MIYVPARHWKGAAMTHEDGTTPLNHLVKVLRLGDPSEYRGHTYISGESLYFPTGRVYGGQVIAQSLIAASKTVSPSRLPHSVHGYFIAAGDIRQDLLFDVETLRDGRSFSARRVNVTQSEGPILTAIASFQEQGQSGVEFSDTMPQDVPAPETLTSAKELMEPYADKSPVRQVLCKEVAVRHPPRHADHHARRRQGQRGARLRQAAGVDEGRRRGGRAAR